jgi:hypothetical protein
VEFKSTIPAFEQAKTVHALDHAATVISKKQLKLKFGDKKLRDLHEGIIPAVI